MSGVDLRRVLWMLPVLLVGFWGLHLVAADRWRDSVMSVAAELQLGDPPDVRMRVVQDDPPDPDGWKINYYHAGFAETLTRTQLRTHDLGLVLLPSLLLLTPVPWWRRLILLAVGTGLLWAGSVLFLCLHVQLQPHAKAAEQTLGFWRSLGGTWRHVFAVHGLLLSLMVWGILAWHHWLPRPPAEAEPEKKGAARKKATRKEPAVARNAPCPCGSGKKYKRCCGRAA